MKKNTEKKITFLESAQTFVKPKFTEEQWNRMSASERRTLTRALLKGGLLTPAGLKKVKIKGVRPFPCLEI